MIYHKIFGTIILLFFVFFECLGSVCHAGGQPWQLLHILKPAAIETPLQNPTALYIDQHTRRYYVVDFGNNRLVSFSESGEFLNSFNGSGQLTNPFDMIKDGRDTIIVLEKVKNSLTKILLKEKKIREYHITYKGKIITPSRIGLLADAIIILENASGKIYSVNHNFEVTGEFSSPLYPDGFSNFIVKDNAVWGMTRGDLALIKFSPANIELESITISQDSPVTTPVSFDIDKNGHIYILDRFSREISVFTFNGKYQYSFLKKGTKAPDLSYPIEIKFDFNDNLCVVDEGNGKVGVYSR